MYLVDVSVASDRKMTSGKVRGESFVHNIRHFLFNQLPDIIVDLVKGHHLDLDYIAPAYP